MKKAILIINKRIEHYKNMLKNDKYTKSDFSLQCTINAIIRELETTKEFIEHNIMISN